MHGLINQKELRIMKQLFNNYVQSLETYIMFRIKQKTMELQEELTAKNRAPIYLSMGAPIQAPPKFVTEIGRAHV